MDILNGLAQLLGLNKSPAQASIPNGKSGGTFPQQAGQWQDKIPVGTSLAPQDIQRLPQNVQGLAQVYNQNPQDPRVAHIDPAMFGYKADNTSRSGQEDDGLVNTPNGLMPLSSLNPGQKWQNPQNGYSPNGFNAAKSGYVQNGLSKSAVLGPLYSLLNR